MVLPQAWLAGVFYILEIGFSGLGPLDIVFLDLCGRLSCNP